MPDSVSSAQADDRSLATTQLQAFPVVEQGALSGEVCLDFERLVRILYYPGASFWNYPLGPQKKPLSLCSITISSRRPSIHASPSGRSVS
eukprot:3878605-Pyramimonas_sp.AAC.1